MVCSIKRIGGGVRGICKIACAKDNETEIGRCKIGCFRIQPTAREQSADSYKREDSVETGIVDFMDKYLIYW